MLGRDYLVAGPTPCLKLVLVLGVVCVWGTAPAHAADVVPAKVQIPVLVKALAFDRSLPQRSAGTVVWTVLYNPKVASSKSLANEVIEALSAVGNVGKLPLRFAAVAYDGGQQLEETLKSQRVSVLYVSSSLEGEIAVISSLTRSHRVTSIACDGAGVRNGLTVAVENRGNRPTIMVNLASSKAEGTDFSSQLMRLVEIIR